MRDEVHIKMDVDTLRLTHEEQLPNLQPFDSEGFYKVDKDLNDTEAHHDSGKTLWPKQQRIFGLKPSKIDNSLYMDPQKLPSLRRR